MLAANIELVPWSSSKSQLFITHWIFIEHFPYGECYAKKWGQRGEQDRHILLQHRVLVYIYLFSSLGHRNLSKTAAQSLMFFLPGILD